ncbi:MAG: hypothetical protein PVH88_21295 [Ignavibacteria bacterium]|jgi:hypothetical protein
MMNKNLIILFVTVFLLLNCSSKETQKEKTEPEVKEKEVVEEVYEPTIFIDVDKIYCWVDLMPKVNGRNKFHVTGEITVHESDDYELQNLRLERIKIFQNGKLIYIIKPTIQENELTADKDERNFLFSTIKGLTLYPDFDIEKEINVEFIFRDNSDSYTYKVFEQSIEKVH